MDYEFTRDLLAQPQISLSMEQQALGDFLQDELNTPRAVAALLRSVEQVSTRQRLQADYQGQGFSLHIDSCEVSIERLSADFNDGFGDSDDHQDLDICSHANHASCGLDDFKFLLEDWLSFVSRS